MKRVIPHGTGTSVEILPAAKLSTQTDVSLDNPQDGDSLVFDAVLNKWVNEAIVVDLMGP